MADSETFDFEDFHRELLAARPEGAARSDAGADRLLDNILVVEQVDSTQRLARAIARDYLEEALQPPPLVLVAARQTAGRGRQGRSWVSPAGAGIWATLLWNPATQEASPADDRALGEALALLPLRVAVALARAVEDLVGRPCRVKWPNDLIVGEAKIGGILIEALSRGQGRLALIGFGVNHHLEPGSPPAPDATSLAAEASSPPSLGRSFWSLVSSLGTELLAHRDAPRVVDDFRRLSRHRDGETMVCRVGERRLEGVFRGFDDRGFLQLEIDGEVESLAAGEVIEHGD